MLTRSHQWESNPRPNAYEALALPTELWWLVCSSKTRGSGPHSLGQSARDYTNALANSLPSGDNRDMRIAMLSYHTCPLATLGGKEAGGMNVYVRELVRALGRRGVGVDVFTRSQDEHVPHVLHDLGYGNRVVHVPSGPEYPLPASDLPVFVDDYVEWIQSFTERKVLKYDVIHSHYWLSGQAAMQLRNAWGIPFVQMFHTLGAIKNRVARYPEERASSLRLEMERMILAEADHIVASTEAEPKQFQSITKVDPRQISIVEPGVDTARFYPIPADEAREYVGINDRKSRAILFVGRIEPLKGLDSLLRAVAMVCEDDLHLMVIGGDPDADPVSAEMARSQALVKDLGIEQRVTFLGRRDQDVLQYFYSAAETVVMPSHYESFGLVALEAMACGTPVVASETGGLVFLVKDGETGFHVPAAAPEMLAETLDMLFNDRALLKKLGSQAEQYAQGFSWGAVADRTIEIYRDLVAARQTAPKA